MTDATRNEDDNNYAEEEEEFGTLGPLPPPGILKKTSSHFMESECETDAASWEDVDEMEE